MQTGSLEMSEGVLSTDAQGIMSLRDEQGIHIICFIVSKIFFPVKCFCSKQIIFPFRKGLIANYRWLLPQIQACM